MGEEDRDPSALANFGASSALNTFDNTVPDYFREEI
jgi:hypothetical protein